MSLTIFTHSNGRQYKSDEGTLVSIGNSYTGSQEVGVKDTVGVGTTNVYKITMAFAKIISCVMYSTGPTTATTKASGTTKDTFSLLAKNMLEGNDTVASATPIPFTANFDELDANNTGAAAVTFQARFLYSP